VQTFLPYASFRASVRVLDDRRLGKQRVETYQILRSLLFAQYAWKNHPAVRMWRGFVPALVSYGIAACDAWIERGYGDSVRDSLLAFTGGEVPDQQRLRADGHLPPWLGHPELHRSHRSALLRKDPDSYREAFGEMPSDLPYFWPPDCFPRWPFRRPRPRPVTVEQALAAARFEEFLPGQREAVAGIASGRDVLCCLPPRGGSTCAGLMAAMTRPAAALWVWPGASPDLEDRDGPAPRDRPKRNVAPANSRPSAPSTARPPTEEDTAEMEAEIAAEREHLYRHPDDLPAMPAGRSRRVGLIVVERSAELTAAHADLVTRTRDRFPGVPMLALSRPASKPAQRRLRERLRFEDALVVAP
jgi:hypothetical protein